jgi:peptide/nickel transport system substrate-binding protein
MKKSLPLVLSLLLAAGLFLSACAAQTAPATTPTAAPAGKAGGALVMAFPDEPVTLDPHKSRVPTAEVLLSRMGSSLVALAPDGSVIPYGAQSWTVSTDGLVYEFNLRTDVLFHNGQSVTAQDYVWTYQRALDPAGESNAADVLLRLLSSAEAVDDYTLRLTLSEPYAPFLYNLTNSAYTQPLPQTALQEMGEELLGLRPVGSGPYQFKNWLPRSRLIVESNPDYTWGPQIGENTGAYFIQFIEYRISRDYAARRSMLETGKYGFITLDKQDAAVFSTNNVYQIYTQPIQGLNPYIALNLQQPPFDDLNVRKALNLAIDRDALIEEAVDGHAIIQCGPLSAGMLNYWSGADEAGCGFDAGLAAESLQTTGYRQDAAGTWSKDGQPLALEFLSAQSDEASILLTQAVVEQYRQFGIDARIPPATASEAAQKLQNGDFQAAIAGWNHFDASLLYQLFHSSKIGAPSGAPANIHRLDNPQLDALLEQILFNTDQTANQQAAFAAQQWLAENAAMIPLYTPVAYTIMRAGVEGVSFSPASGFFFGDAYFSDQD